MLEKTVTIKSATGLHARPAGLLTTQAKKFKSRTVLIHGEKEIDAKSILNIMAGGIVSGTTLTLRCEGEDEARALDTLSGFIEGLEG